MNSLLTENWIVTFVITTASVYLILIKFFKASTIQRNNFIISYVILVLILDAIFILNREEVSPELFKGLSMGLLMGMVFAVLRKSKNSGNV
ncbi:hypothetical protein [Pseudoneobacillus sp. C159]